MGRRGGGGGREIELTRFSVASWSSTDVLLNPSLIIKILKTIAAASQEWFKLTIFCKGSIEHNLKYYSQRFAQVGKKVSKSARSLYCTKRLTWKSLLTQSSFTGNNRNSYWTFTSFLSTDLCWGTFLATRVLFGSRACTMTDRKPSLRDSEVLDKSAGRQW